MKQLTRNAAVAAALLLAEAPPCPASAAGIVELQGRGVQVYACEASAAGFAWTPKGPDATLFDMLGQPSGRHFAGPSWQAKDGSIVGGEAVASGSGDAGTIPWLLLRAKAHTGQGVFAEVGYVVRSHTSGGVAPAYGCQAGQAGAEARVSYRADYMFFPAPDAGRR